MLMKPFRVHSPDGKTFYEGPEPYGYVVCHKGIPNAIQEFIPADFYRESDWEGYSVVPVFTKEPV